MSLNPINKRTWLQLALATLALGATVPAAAQNAPQVARVRGTIEAVNLAAHTMAFRGRGGELFNVQVAEPITVAEVYPIELGDIKQGSYIGTAAMPAADGTLQAIEVVVFPVAQRGVGEGHRPYDLQP